MSNIQLVENLYRLRKAHHYTQQEISDLLNISRQAYPTTKPVNGHRIWIL